MNAARMAPLGEIPRIGDIELQAKFDELATSHNDHLAALGVKLPSFRWRGLYSQRALALIALYIRFGNPVTKDELESFVRKYKEGARDVQDGRHLANTDGWRVLSERRGDAGTETWPKDSYGLVSLTEAHPSFRSHRSGDLTDPEWKAIKERFQNRCSLCGSREGEPNLRTPSAITQLERGHMNPLEALTPTNCIPQCQHCNRPLQEKFIFDAKGRPRAIARADLILSSPEDVQIEVLHLLREKFEK